METPVPFILLALRGRADFVRLTSPFGGGKPPAKADPSPADVATRIRALMGALRKA